MIVDFLAPIFLKFFVTTLLYHILSMVESLWAAAKAVGRVVLLVFMTATLPLRIATAFARPTRFLITAVLHNFMDMTERALLWHILIPYLAAAFPFRSAISLTRFALTLPGRAATASSPPVMRMFDRMWNAARAVGSVLICLYKIAPLPDRLSASLVRFVLALPERAAAAFIATLLAYGLASTFGKQNLAFPMPPPTPKIVSRHPKPAFKLSAKAAAFVAASRSLRRERQMSQK
ncbi:hypothetical protein DFJ73DRAFT_792047 [Zopfochytrium polystomum]|nr:hypothetical protein DFJ73DRAFT_792047 [Zopfochytrium polystomum]